MVINLHNIRSSAVLLLLGALLSTSPVQARRPDGERKAERIERRADRRFVAQHFEKAMLLYEAAIVRMPGEGAKATLHCKAARLYFMLRQYPLSALHYEKVMTLDETQLAVTDVCDYLDALRFTGRDKEAEAICLKYAYKDQYSRHQRYENILEALAMRYGMDSRSGYKIAKLRLNTSASEYWVGLFGDQLFYAKSKSPFNDPHKLFFNQTHYYTLDPAEQTTDELQFNDRKQRRSRPSLFPYIPLGLQDGPMTLATDGSLMINTSIVYIDKARVVMQEGRLLPYATQLLTSAYDAKRNRWSAYKPAFEQIEGVSYAHPFLCEDNRTLIFTSDMPGGYGGFDLYMSQWDSQSHQWSTPRNLGSDVNTEGDELFPILFGGRLVFASNGHPGFGGYDLFSMMFEEGEAVSGGLTHFPAPVNSVYNDFYLRPVDAQSGYFVSDRDTRTGDDIYAYWIDRSQLTGSSPFFGMSEEHAVASGAFRLADYPDRSEGGIDQMLLPAFRRASRELLCTVYFDFDSPKLDAEARETLDRFLNNSGYMPEQIDIVGFADDIGGEQYNAKLSSERADAVAGYLKDKIYVPFHAEGRGSLQLSDEEVAQALRLFDIARSLEMDRSDWIRINRRARRVDIYNKTDNQ